MFSECEGVTLKKKSNELSAWKFSFWVVLTPIMLLLNWYRLNAFKKVVAIVWSFLLIFKVVPSIYDSSEETRRAESVTQDQEGEIETLPPQRIDEVWSIGDYVENLRASDVLVGDAEFVDKKMGNSIQPVEEPTEMENPMLLQLTVESDGLNPEDLTEIAYRISERVYKQKRDFVLASVYISFIDRNGDIYRDSTNFSLGINTISGFFEDAQVEKSPQSFFQWIEDHFTLPEDDDFLVENESWTLLSEKSNP